MVDVGDAPVEVGDEVVLLGRQGDDEVTAPEWADHLGTISYEIVTGIGARVPRSYTGEPSDGDAVAAWPDGRDAATESTVDGRSKRTGIVTGVAAGVVGVAYGAERAVVARLRHGDDPDADCRSSRVRRHPTSTPTTAAPSTPSAAATGRRSCSPRRHAVVACVGQAVRRRSPPRASARWRSTPAGTASRTSARAATRSTTSPTTSAACSRPSTCTTRSSSGTRWAAWRSRRS